MWNTRILYIYHYKSRMLTYYCFLKRYLGEDFCLFLMKILFNFMTILFFRFSLVIWDDRSGEIGTVIKKPLEQTKSSLSQIKQKFRALTRVCASLSTESLITDWWVWFGFNWENRSPLVNRDLDQCDVPLRPEDVASPSAWTNSPFPNREWIWLTLSWQWGGCRLKIESSQVEGILHTQSWR